MSDANKKYLHYTVPAMNVDSLVIIDVGEDINRGEKMSLHPRFHYVIHFVREGKGHYKFNDTQTEISANSAFAIYKDVPVSYFPKQNDLLHYFWVGFDGNNCNKIMNYLGFSRNIPVINLDNPDIVEAAFKELLSAGASNDIFYLNEKFLTLLRVLKTNNRLSATDGEKNDDNFIVIEAKKYIEEHFIENIKICDIVSHLHIDRSYFSKVFKRIVGVSPHEYIVRLKLSKAEQLFYTTTYSISEIVNFLNFTDIYSFSKLFKKYYNVSPSEFKKMKVRKQQDSSPPRQTANGSF